MEQEKIDKMFVAVNQRINGLILRQSEYEQIVGKKLDEFRAKIHELDLVTQKKKYSQLELI